MKVLATERSRQLAEQNGWSLAFSQGHVDGEASRRSGKALAVRVRVGIDQYSLGFRAGYFERQAATHPQAMGGVTEFVIPRRGPYSA